MLCGLPGHTPAGELLCALWKTLQVKCMKRSLKHSPLHPFANSIFSSGVASMLQCEGCLHITANLYIGKLFEVSDI